MFSLFGWRYPGASGEGSAFAASWVHQKDLKLCGLKLNKEKSKLEPMQVGQWLGFVTDTIGMQFGLPPMKISRLKVVICVFKQGYTLGKISSLFKKDLEMIILRNNSHGGITRVCMRIFTTALRTTKNTSNYQKKKKNNSPYFHSVLLVIWLLTLMKRTHFSESSISRFPTYIRKAQGWTLHFRTIDLRSEKFQRKMTGRPQIQRRIQTHIL